MVEQKEDVRGALKRRAATSNKPGLDGGLPETMPAGVLLTPYMQSLQQALLPFQVLASFIALLKAPSAVTHVQWITEAVSAQAARVWYRLHAQWLRRGS